MDDVFYQALLLIAVIFIFIRSIISKWRRKGRNRAPQKKELQWKPDHAAEQLTTVMRSEYSKKRLMNKSEFRVFKILENKIKKKYDGRRIFAQVSLGEILQAEDHAHRAINSKRVDILIIDGAGYPVLAVEHQGRAHFIGNAAARDAVKREALRRAGVPLVETFDEDTEEDILRKVYRILGWPPTPSEQTAACPP